VLTLVVVAVMVVLVVLAVVVLLAVTVQQTPVAVVAVTLHRVLAVLVWLLFDT